MTEFSSQSSSDVSKLIVTNCSAVTLLECSARFTVISSAIKSLYICEKFS